MLDVGWMDGYGYGQMDGYWKMLDEIGRGWMMDGWMDGYWMMDGWMDGQMDMDMDMYRWIWIDGQMDRWMWMLDDGWMLDEIGRCWMMDVDIG